MDAWNDSERIQALYTLVRKSDSLAPAARSRLVKSLCNAVHGLCSALSNPGVVVSQHHDSSQEGSTFVVSQSFRDALACHIYFLFTLMFLTESKEKLGKSLLGSNGTNGKTKSKGGRSKKSKDSDGDMSAANRSACAEAMHFAAITMCEQKSRLWKRSVPDEAVVGLPCRIAYQMLESATGVVARKASSGDEALEMIAATVDSAPCLLNTVVAALVDLLHTYDHMAPLVAELCCKVNEKPSNVLATELLREIGRLDTEGYTDQGGKASGIKNVAPLISELAAVRPRVVLSNLSLLLPHLDSEPYVLRSAIISSIGHILVREDQTLVVDETRDTASGGDEETKKDDERQIANMGKTRSALFDILCERTRDVTSFTRGASLKVLNELTEKQSVPLDRIMPVTEIAIDRLNDKTVMVRRYAMQVSSCRCSLFLDPNPSF